MGPEYTEKREKIAIDIVNRHTSDILGYYLLHEVAINYMPPAKWLELFDKMEPWLKTKPTLYKYLSQFKAEREAALKNNEGPKFIELKAALYGRVCRLSDDVGNGRYVLTDFWGTICGLCLA